MRYVIIGGDAAGMSAAMQILKFDKKASIITLEKGNYYSYAQCGLPYVLSELVSDPDQLVMRSVTTYRDRFGIDARIGHEVRAVDPVAKTVSGIETESAKPFTLAYDKLLVATGADPYVPEWPGVHLPGVHTLKTIPDTKAMTRQLEAGVQDVTIIGGGYIALEVAENFRLLGKTVRIVNRSEQVGKMFDRDMAEHIHAEAKKHEIDIRLHEQTVAIEGKQTVRAVRTDQATYETDLVVVATGIRPNTTFLQDTGIKTASNGAIHVNEYMQTNVSDIYAAGDCATQFHRVKRLQDYIPLGTHANKQGRLAGMNMAGKARAFKGIVGTSILRFMDLSLGKTGLSDREAQESGIPYSSVIVKAKHIANYYPGAKDFIVKLTYRSDDSRLLGGQIIGEAGVDKRIDVLATALFNEMTVVELEDLDLSYAPPYNGVWDPIQRAARKAMR